MNRREAAATAAGIRASIAGSAVTWSGSFRSKRSTNPEVAVRSS